MTPTYDYEIETLRKAYEEALANIGDKLQKLSLTDFERAQITATMVDIKDILAELDDTATAWVADNIPRAAGDGVAQALVSLGLAKNLAEAANIVKFSELNREFIKTAIADTQDDLLQVTRNVERKVRAAIRQATADTMRHNLTQGINGTASLKRDLLSRMDDVTKSGIIDAAGRRWQPQVYASMVVQTKMAATQREVAINQGVEEGAYYGVISKHGAKDACAKWEGRVIKLVADAPGDYPYIGDLPTREIFHPRCRHVVSPVRKPERYNNDQ